jgi:hypothetical protein
MQDVPGTLQGNWFLDEALSSEWSRHLAFVYSNGDPSVAVISIEGGFSAPIKWEFVPEESGLSNRKFSDVTADESIYCYDRGQPGRVLVQLTSDTGLRIEHQGGSCTGAMELTNPAFYGR